jgi:hypothetical protein
VRTTEDLVEEGRALATQWVSNVFSVLDVFEYYLNAALSKPPQSTLESLLKKAGHLQYIFDALATHFKLGLVAVPSTLRTATAIANVADLTLIRRNYSDAFDVLKNSSKYFNFVSGGANVFPAYADGPSRKIYFDRGIFIDWAPAIGALLENGFGRYARAAMVLHECIHVVDLRSGPHDDAWLYEHRRTYETQTAGQAVHNASSYASFAQHVNFGRDMRFGGGRVGDDSTFHFTG